MGQESTTVGKFGWLAGTGTLLSILACYGTLATLAVLSLLGITLVVDPGVWAGTISLFAVLAVVGVAVTYRQHGKIVPLLIALVGAGLILWAMFGSYSRIIELLGFGGLIIAATWDWRLKKRMQATT